MAAPLGRAHVVVEDGDNLGLGEGLHHGVQQVHSGAAHQLRVGREPLLPIKLERNYLLALHYNVNYGLCKYTFGYFDKYVGNSVLQSM